MAILFEIFSEHFVSPKSSEYFISVVTILEFLVELVGSTCVGDAAVEVDKTDSKILGDNIAIFELLVNYACFGIV